MQRPETGTRVPFFRETKTATHARVPQGNNRGGRNAPLWAAAVQARSECRPFPFSFRLSTLSKLGAREATTTDPSQLQNRRWRRREECSDAQAGVPSAEASGATCVQGVDGSRISAIHIEYRISLRSSSLRGPRYSFAESSTLWCCSDRTNPQPKSEGGGQPGQREIRAGTSIFTVGKVAAAPAGTVPSSPPVGGGRVAAQRGGNEGASSMPSPSRLTPAHSLPICAPPSAAALRRQMKTGSTLSKPLA